MPLLEVKDVSFSYSEEILKHISFDVAAGKFVSLLGVNGAGKSTLLHLISRIIKLNHGHVLIQGANLHEISLSQLAKSLAYVTQYNNPIKSTVYDIILAGRIPHLENNSLQSKDFEVVDMIIDKLQLGKLAMREANMLSGGEFQKVVIARALAQEPKLILLDEPTSNLDIHNQVKVMSMLREYCEEKKIAVIASVHDINLALRFSDKFLLLKEGSVYAYGDHDIITVESLQAIYKLQADVIYHKNQKVIVFI